MKKMDLLNYVKSNQETINKNFYDIFSLDKTEVNEIMFQIMSINFSQDEFFSQIYKDETFYNCFKMENLTSLRNFLMQIGLDNQNLKRVVTDVPEIILLSDKIESIYPLFKCDDFKGITFLQGNSFKSYMLPKIIDFYKVKKFRNYDFNIEYENLIRLEYYNEYENREPVAQLMETLNRTESMTYYGLSNTSTLKDKFDALASVFDQFNYYFLKPRNTLIERKARQTAMDENKMYCCDLCAKKFEEQSDINTRHIIPLNQGGKDDIYNITCLCDECQDRVEVRNVNLAKTEQIMSSLRRRIYNNYPQYHNVLLAWFNIN